MTTIDFSDFQKVDVRAGVVREVHDFPEARNPAYRVVVDFGGEVGLKTSAVQATNYDPNELEGMEVVGVVNLPPLRMGPVKSEVLILGVPGSDGELSLLTPSRPANPGGRMF